MSAQPPPPPPQAAATTTTTTITTSTPPAHSAPTAGDNARTAAHADADADAADAASASAAAPQLPEKAPLAFDDQTRYLKRSKVIMVFMALAAVAMVALIDQTTLSVALPTISESLHAGAQQSWVINGYFIATTSFQLLYGRLSDILSRKVLLLVSLGFFFIGSVGASESQTIIQLIIFRSITGIGGGALISLAQVVISDIVTLRERGKYQGIMGSVVATSNGIGPVIGGAIAGRSAQSWRWIFRMNLFLSGFAVLCVLFFLPLKGVKDAWAKKLRAIDYGGAVLILASSVLVVLGLSWAGQGYNWETAHVLAPLIVGIAVAIAFVLWEWKSPLPLMPLCVFKRKVVCGSYVHQAINGWNFYVQIFYIPTFYQISYGYGPLQAGALLLVLLVCNSLTSMASGWIVSWRGKYRESILAGWMLWAIGLGLFSTANRYSSVGSLVGFSVMMGLGSGSTLQPGLIALQAAVPRKDMAVVTSLRQFLRQLGATIGLAVAGTIINNLLRAKVEAHGLHLSRSQLNSVRGDPARAQHIPGVDPSALRDALLDGYESGFRIVFLLGACLCAVAFLAVLLLVPDLGLDRPDDEKLKEEEKERELGLAREKRKETKV